MLLAVAAAASMTAVPPAHAVTSGYLRLVLDMPYAVYLYSQTHYDGSLSGEFTGVLRGETVVAAPVTGWFNYYVDSTLCPFRVNAAGTMNVGSVVTYFAYTRVGTLFFMTTSGGETGFVPYGPARPDTVLCDPWNPRMVDTADGVWVGV